LLRDKGVFSIQEVEYAILETNGYVSVLKKSPYQTPNKKDLHVYPEDVYLPYTLISDGELIVDNLKEAQVSEEWLYNELKRQQYNRVEDIYYAEYIEGQKLFILPFTEKNERSEEHTSELQSRFDLVCRLLLEKKKKLP